MGSTSSRAISAAIVFVGACILMVGSLATRGDVSGVAGFAGFLVGALALIVWMSTLGIEIRPPGGK